MARIKGLVFDKDGTLFDFQATWGVWSEGMIEAEAGGDSDLADRIAERIGFDPATRRFRPDSVIAAPTEALAERLLPLLHGTGKAELMTRLDARAAQARQVEAAPLGELLARLLDMGLTLGIATNDMDAPARSHLRAAGIEDQFAFIACYDSGWGAKPDAGQLLAFARATGLAPGECAMVGDSLHDLAAARSAGMLGVAVLTGLTDRATLELAADVVLTSVAELPGWLAARDGPAGSPL